MKTATSALLGILLLSPLSAALADTTVNDTDKYSFAANVGWINWEGDVTDGAHFNTRFASGYIYAANIGWICLGDGTPAANNVYANDSAEDFGVNVDAESDPDFFLLSGYAYSANTGWLVFEVADSAGEEDQPRIDKTTGVMTGYVWSPNAGWIALESMGIAQVQTEVPSEDLSGWMLR
ncbi:hypothetical protein KQI84_12775 [bacterium]|nr:hypothetical protein [bacterium]